jgi:hypothetical protein
MQAESEASTPSSEEKAFRVAFERDFRGKRA